MTLTFLHGGTSCVLRCTDPDRAHRNCHKTQGTHRPSPAPAPVSAVPSPVAPVSPVPAVPPATFKPSLLGPDTCQCQNSFLHRAEARHRCGTVQTWKLGRAVCGCL